MLDTIVIAALVLWALWYVIRHLWPKRNKHGCDGCPLPQHTKSCGCPGDHNEPE